MTDWVLIPCLKALFAGFDRIAPSRDRTSDGSIGNTAHQNEVSDHNPDETGRVPIHDADHVNEVHAIDVDNNLRVPALGPDPMETVVQFLLSRCRSGQERRLRYIIYRRRIWSASSGWMQKTYTGASPHTEHAHFSASYDTALEASTASWHLGDLMALDNSDVSKIWAAEWQGADRAYPASSWLINANKYAAAALAEAKAAREELAALRGVVQTLADAVKAGGGSVDTAAILAGVDARLAAARGQFADELAARLAS